MRTCAHAPALESARAAQLQCPDPAAHAEASQPAQQRRRSSAGSCSAPACRAGGMQGLSSAHALCPGGALAGGSLTESCHVDWHQRRPRAAVPMPACRARPPRASWRYWRSAINTVGGWEGWKRVVLQKRWETRVGYDCPCTNTGASRGEAEGWATLLSLDSGGCPTTDWMSHSSEYGHHMT